MRCLRRDPKAARIALILDSYGGARTIVADKRSMRLNVRHDELVHVVPSLIVHTPIAWNDIPVVIARSEVEFEMWLDTRPNLTEEQDRAVRLYRLRKQRHNDSKESLDLYSIVET